MAAQYPTAAGTDANLWVGVNNKSTSLSDNPLTSGATTVNVASTTGFPTTGYITIEAEAIKYTGVTGTSFTGCTRGADGTTAASHVTATQVFHDVVADHHNVLKDEIKAVEGDLVGTMAAITPVTAASTSTSLLQRLAHIVSQIKIGFGLTNWYDVISPAVLTAGAQTVAGVKSFSSSLRATIATNILSLTGSSTTSQIGCNYEVGTISNTSDSSANINLNCPAGAATITIGTSAAVNTAPSTVASFANTGLTVQNTTSDTGAFASGITLAPGAGLNPGAIIGQQRTASVSTSAVTIYSIQLWGNMVMVVGWASSVNLFTDVVLCTGTSATPTVMGSHTVGASARTYSWSSGNLLLAVASGTYNVNCLVINQNQG